MLLVKPEIEVVPTFFAYLDPDEPLDFHLMDEKFPSKEGVFARTHKGHYNHCMEKAVKLGMVQFVNVFSSKKLEGEDPMLVADIPSVKLMYGGEAFDVLKNKFRLACMKNDPPDLLI